MTDLLRKQLQACIEDPMWSDHAEVSKVLLQKVLDALSAPAAGGLTDAEIDALIAEHCDPVATYGGLRRLVLAAAGRAQQQPDDTGRMVALEHHNRLTSHGMRWTDQRLDANGLNCARAVFGTCNEDDDKRVYRTIQAYLSAANAKPEEAKSGTGVRKRVGVLDCGEAGHEDGRCGNAACMTGALKKAPTP